MSTSHLNKTELVEAYMTGESASSLARRHKVSVWSIITRLRKAGVEMRSSKAQNERRLETPVSPPPFTFRELVDGLLLGDGSIDRKGLLRLEQCEQRLGWIEQVKQLLHQLGAESVILPLPARKRPLKEENRIIQGKPGNLLYTPAFVELKLERKRWYPGGSKLVPRDLRLTPPVVAHWFAGDGTYGTNGVLSFCTNSFSADEVDFLIKRLADDLDILEARRAKTPRPGQYTLGVYRKDQVLKLKVILEPLLPDCCQYKLQHVRPPKYGHLLPDQVRDIRRRAAEGESISDLVERFTRSETTIYNIVAGRSHRSIRSPGLLHFP